MVKLQDIADRTGFSLAVVSRALNPRPDQKVAEKSAAIIRKAAEELGYRPNQAARLLAKGANPAIGIFLPRAEAGGSLILSLVAGLTQTANRFGFACNFHFGLEEEEYLAFLQSVRQERHAGIITYLPAAYTHDAVRAMLDKLRRQNCQVVVVNTPEMPDDPRVSGAAIDNRFGGRLAAEHLLACGVRRFLILNHPSSWQIRERCRGFAECVAGAGRAAEEVAVRMDGAAVHEKPSAANRTLWKKLLESREALGVFAGTDFVAAALYGELARHGESARIGRELRLVGFDDQPMAPLLYPALTSVRQPFRQLGEVSMSLLLNRLIDARIAVPETVLKPELIARASSGGA